MAKVYFVMQHYEMDMIDHVVFEDRVAYVSLSEKKARDFCKQLTLTEENFADGSSSVFKVVERETDAFTSKDYRKTFLAYHSSPYKSDGERT